MVMDMMLNITKLLRYGWPGCHGLVQLKASHKIWQQHSDDPVDGADSTAGRLTTN